MAPRLVVGIGTQKAATTTLAEFLGERGVALHPDKELHAFNDANRVVSREEYLSKFATLPDDGWFSEFSPEYCMHVHALLNIKRLFPDAKLVFSYRNPITRLQSAYRHATAMNLIDRKLSLDEVIGLSFRGHPEHWIDNLLRYGQYDKMLQMIERVFDSKNVYVVRYEDLGTADERAALNGLLRMLELEELPADFATLEPRNTSGFYRNEYRFEADSTISDSNMSRLQDFFAPVEAALKQRGLKAEWF